MKKTLLLITGLIILGGITYWISSSGILQGAFMIQSTGKNVKPDLKTVEISQDSITTDALDTESTDARTLLEENSTATISNTSCSSLMITPDTITVSSEEEANTGIDFTINISLTDSEDDSWKSTLVINNNGNGIFTDDRGNTGTSLVLPVSSSHNSFDINYADGASGDTVSAYLKEEQGCHDSVLIKLQQSSKTSSSDQTKTGTLSCTSLDISPDSYELAAEETSMNFTVAVKGTEQTSWKEWVKNWMTFTFNTADTNSTAMLGNLVIETDGSGTLSNNKNSDTGTSINVAIKGTGSLIKASYENPTNGDTIKAYIEGQEDSCTDYLILKTTETSVSIGIETSTTETSATETSATETSTTETPETLSTEAETIIGDSNYSCNDPFVDTGSGEWYTDLFCRMYQAGVFSGKTTSLAAPNDYLTVAEAIKIIGTIAGYKPMDAAKYTEDFLDVSEKDWYAPYVILAQQKNWVRTRDAGYYLNPNNPISRGWFVLYATRAAGKILPPDTWDESDIPFTDLDVSDPYTYAIILAYRETVSTPEANETTLVTGYNDGTFHPDAFITRAEAAALAQRFYLAWFLNK